jgi:hypothetical protein
MIEIDGESVRDFHHFVSVPEGRSGNVEVQHEVHPAGYAFDTANLRCQMFGQKNLRVTYDCETTWRRLMIDGSLWMTDLPIEQQQHRNSLSGMHGRVLVGGLGLGIAVTILDLNPDVSEIVVVEKNADVVNLVWPHIYRRLGETKVRCVNQDLYEFLGRPAYEQDVFDFAFYDIWTSDSEGTFHEIVQPLREKTMAAGLVDGADAIVNWNEDVMRGQLARAIATRFQLARISEDAREIARTENLASHSEETARSVVHGSGQPTFEELAEPIGSIYWDWCAPFFRWVLANRDGVPDQRLVDASQHYAYGYGIDDGDYWA